MQCDRVEASLDGVSHMTLSVEVVYIYVMCDVFVCANVHAK
jgi:hypothetical protein